MTNTYQKKLLELFAEAQQEILTLKHQRDAAIAILRIGRAKGYFSKELEGKL